MSESYYGYTNYETWLFYCTEGDYLENYIIDYLEDSQTPLEYGQVFTIVNGHLDWLLEEHNIHGSTFFDSLLNNSIRKLDLHCIAQKIYDEIVLQYNDND